MIIKSACGVLETFMELLFSVGMFVELCGRKKLRGKLARVLAGMVLVVYIAIALSTNIILLQCLPDVLYFTMPLLCLSLCILIQEEWRRAISWSVFVSGTILMLRLPIVLICAVVYDLSYSECIISSHQWTNISILLIEAVIFACCIRKRNILGEFINKLSIQNVFFLLTGFIEIVIILYVVNVDWEKGYDIHSIVLMIVLIILLLLIIISLVLMLEYHVVVRTNHILKEDESRMKVYYDLLSDEIQHKLKKSHDKRYDYEYLYSCLMQKEYEKCENYLKEKCTLIGTQMSMFYTGHGAVDYLIGKNVNRCRENNIKVTVNVEMHKFPIAENEFFVLLANLLDNAVEAALKCIDERFVEIRMHEMSNMFRLYIANSYAEEPVKAGRRLVSGKNNSGDHGWGLESVKDTVKKYDGTADIVYENGKFVVDIVFIFTM
ncbi:MAG: ATP-binding protein [Lachnospiraceae bacterium]|nr:ATP-binding protein [Lachnospiraceae bacterium]